MTTEELIKKMRKIMPVGPISQNYLKEAAARLESLQWELTQAIAERTPHDYGLLREEADFLRKERDKALAEVERVRKLWNESHIAERDDFAKEIERVKAECANQQLNTRPEPSRLEIAVIVRAGMQHKSVEVAVKLADELIAAVKEAK